jgi:group II intron reverse transcriptase/maturase
MGLEEGRHQKSKREPLPRERDEVAITKQGGESSTAADGDERSGSEHLMERVVARENMRTALKRVRQNKGGPGVDGMTVDELPSHLHEHWLRIREALLVGQYKPQSVLRREIPKNGGGTRELGVPTVVDRLIQQAILQVLQPRWDTSFSESSYGFRPGRRAHDAVRAAKQYIKQGRRYVVDVDLEKFFDRVNHDVLMGRLAKRIEDRRLLTLIRGYLEAGVMLDGVVMERYEGTPQGGPLSPLLANVLLDEVDKALEKQGHKFARYADDCNVYVRSRRAGERVMASLRRHYAKLRLRVNETKSAVAPVWERKFLGYSFWKREGEAKLRVADQAIARLKDRVRGTTKPTVGRSMRQVAQELRRYLLGWKEYFRLAETPRVFLTLDKWIRHRLRALQLKQWRRGRTIYRELVARGLSAHKAAKVASQGRRWYRTSRKDIHIALPIAHFDALGIPHLSP